MNTDGTLESYIKSFSIYNNILHKKKLPTKNDRTLQHSLI